ncbi:TonB-dependent receptor plug domain-containing protein [Hyphomicrobium sp. CS1GBMeth3]|uniref:TonB-dependent receptor plug domain-containing protein n=1 Tax=Hyphomicrobium sp. CS1GBMeth3 TaxID=1892845 RepID=UPI0015C55CD2|nr:TonB-dependent receptor plug domain-containing protein [Hyphomicrobium sp. CS1GBMeth3]
MLFSAAGAAQAQETQATSDKTIEQTAAEPADATALPKVVVTSPKEKKKASVKKVTGKGTGSGTSEGGTTGEAAAQDSGGIGGGQNANTTTDAVTLGGPAISDTGTTVFTYEGVRIRTDGSGDANSFMRNLPNVQYQNDTDDNPGITAAKTIDTKPQLLSINGGRTYENNFILNGVSINNITGPVELSDPELGDGELTPNQYAVFGLHPQQVFVPTDFIGQATIIDSNASAEYGEFQGGVVIYDLQKPPTDGLHGSVSYERQTDAMVNYLLATPSKTNPLNRKPPEFEKNKLAASVGAPITIDLSFIAQVSQQTAETRKQKAYYISDDWVDEDSDNKFFRLAATLRTDIGKFTLDSSFTDYTQHWENIYGRDLYIDTESQGSTTKLEYEGRFPGIAVDSIGLGNVNLKSRAYYNKSETKNLSGGDTTYMWYNQRLTNYNPDTGWTENYDTTLHDDWCRGVDPATAPSDAGGVLSCREGGYGNKLQGQEDLGIQAHVTGDVFLGNFKVGAEAKNIEGRRARFEDYYFVAVSRLATDANPVGGSFNCGDDRFCTPEQYASSVSIFEEYDVTASVNAFHTYAEIDQTWEWFNIRAGVRLDYEDYFENLNLAPRVAGTITPFHGLSFTAGFNRYYLGETLYFAIRDKQPRGYTVTRNHNTATGVPNEFVEPGAPYTLSYRDSDLDTPYNDEYTGAVNIKDPLFGGHLRLRYLERYGEDRFARENCSVSGVDPQCYRLTNDGESFYRSATAEYTKHWFNLNNSFHLNAAALTGTVTWSEQNTSRNTFHDDYDGDIYILYKGKSYTPLTFNEVTGNLDIPIRVGATLSTNWFDDLLLLGFSAGYNFGYDGVYDTGINKLFNGVTHDVWDDTSFDPAFKLDMFGQINVTEYASIDFSVNNVTNSPGNAITTSNIPWVRGRSYWVGSTVRF